jgi:hypothetical protein
LLSKYNMPLLLLLMMMLLLMLMLMLLFFTAVHHDAGALHPQGRRNDAARLCSSTAAAARADTAVPRAPRHCLDAVAACGGGPGAATHGTARGALLGLMSLMLALLNPDPSFPNLTCMFDLKYCNLLIRQYHVHPGIAWMLWRPVVAALEPQLMAQLEVRFITSFISATY